MGKETGDHAGSKGICIALEVNLREGISHTSLRSVYEAAHLALKPRGDITRSLKQGISGPKNGHLSNKNFKKR